MSSAQPTGSQQPTSSATAEPTSGASRSTASGSAASTSASRASAAASSKADSGAASAALPRHGVKSWIYQLQDYRNGKLDAIAASPHDLAVIDLARDAHLDYFRADELAALHGRGKTVLAYFEIGSLEDFRPEYPKMNAEPSSLLLNKWPSWPNEYFVRYWEARWWDEVIRPRVDQALRAGFDGVYMDTPLAYEELDLALVPGYTRDELAREMVALIVKISKYAKAKRPGFLIFPQNSPELRQYPGYTPAIDGIGMEELFFSATDQPCTEDYCAENLAETKALRAAGKTVLAVDYAVKPANIASACAAYRTYGFVGYIGDRELNRIRPAC